jgi:hypothetical protein
VCSSDLIPLVFGLLFKKFNARGSLWGLVAGSTTGFVLVLANFVLVGMFAAEMKTNATLEFWLRSGWNSAATVLSIGATILGMWLGTASKPTPPEERHRVTQFFADLSKPFLYEEPAKKPLSPFKTIGYMLIALGTLMAAISILVLVSYKDKGAFRVDLVVALALAGLGMLMRTGRTEKSRPNLSP